MTKRSRRNHFRAFRTKVALEPLKEQQPVIKIAERSSQPGRAVLFELARPIPGCLEHGRVPLACIGAHEVLARTEHRGILP